MIIPKEYNNFNNQKTLELYIEYLKALLKEIDMEVIFKYKYIENKKYADITIIDNKEIILKEKIKTTDISEYEKFNTNFNETILYYIKSKIIAFNIIYKKNIQIVKLKQYDLSNNYLHKQRDKLFSKKG